MRPDELVRDGAMTDDSMNHEASGEYLRNTVMTASPEQLQLMLYDGAIRFAGQAREALTRQDLETSCEKLIRAQNIVLELRNGLRPEVNAALCSQLSALYTFIYNRLVEANMKRSLTAIDDALTILHHQRETWQMLIERAKEERSHEVARRAPGNQEATPHLSLSVEG